MEDSRTIDWSVRFDREVEILRMFSVRMRTYVLLSQKPHPRRSTRQALRQHLVRLKRIRMGCSCSRAGHRYATIVRRSGIPKRVRVYIYGLSMRVGWVHDGTCLNTGRS